MLLVFGAPCQLSLLAGPEHGRTIPLADIGTSPQQALPEWYSLTLSWLGWTHEAVRISRCAWGCGGYTGRMYHWVLNAADEKAFEKALLGHIMWSAFQCSTYAELSDYKSEQERLRLVGLNAGRTFLEALKAGQISEQAAIVPARFCRPIVLHKLNTETRTT